MAKNTVMHNNSPFHRQNRLVQSLLAVLLLPVKNHRIITDYTSRAFQFLFTKKTIICHLTCQRWQNKRAPPFVPFLRHDLSLARSHLRQGVSYVTVLPSSRSYLRHGLTFVTVLPLSRSYLRHSLTFAPSAPATPVFPVAPLLPCNIF